MTSRCKHMTKGCHLALGLLGLIMFGTGCAGPDESETTIARDRTHAMLAAASSHHINMFGELGDDGRSGYFARSAVALKQHTFAEVGADMDPHVDPTGRQIVFASTRHSAQPDLYIKSINGIAVTQLTSDPSSDVQPVFSPDGQHVAFASNRSGNWDIWIIGVNGGQPRQVTSGLADELHPSWAPDGARLVYCSLPAEGGQWELWLTDVAAGVTRKFIGYGLFPEWSPAGDVILYQRARERGGRRFSVWTLTLVDGEPRYPTELAWNSREAYTLPTWSPDGLWIAFASVADPALDDPALASFRGRADLWIMTADGRSKVRLTDGYTPNYAPVFSIDGRIFFASSRGGYDNIWSLLPAWQTPPLDERVTDGVETGREMDEPTAVTISVKGGL